MLLDVSISRRGLADAELQVWSSLVVVIGHEKLQLMHIGPSGPIYTTIPPHSATARPGRPTPQRLFAGDQQASLLP